MTGKYHLIWKTEAGADCHIKRVVWNKNDDKVTIIMTFKRATHGMDYYEKIKEFAGHTARIMFQRERRLGVFPLIADKTQKEEKK